MYCISKLFQNRKMRLKLWTRYLSQKDETLLKQDNRLVSIVSRGYTLSASHFNHIWLCFDKILILSRKDRHSSLPSTMIIILKKNGQYFVVSMQLCWYPYIGYTYQYFNTVRYKIEYRRFTQMWKLVYNEKNSNSIYVS